MENAISGAQSHKLPEGNNHAPHDPNERWTLLATWRLSVAAQPLTPAPDTRAIAWKKAALDGEQWNGPTSQGSKSIARSPTISHFSMATRRGQDF
jgi:hypothetical protein